MKNILNKICLSFISIILIILITHIIHEEFFFENKLNSSVKNFTTAKNYKPFPYIEFKGDPTDSNFNKLGYRGATPCTSCNNIFKLFVLGGSAAANGNPSIAQIIEEKFKNDGYKNIKVYSFASIASNFSQDRIRLFIEVLKYKPNYVVFYNGFNEISGPLWADPRPDYPFNYAITESNPLKIANIKDYPLIDLILFRSSILRQYFPSYFYKQFVKINPIKKQVKYKSQLWTQKVASSYWDNFKLINGLAKGFDFDFSVIYQANLYNKKKRFGSELQRLYVNENKASFYKIYNNLLKLKPEGQNNFHSLINFFDNHNEEVFIDEVHIKQKFRDQITSEIYKLIKEKVVLKLNNSN